MTAYDSRRSDLYVAVRCHNGCWQWMVLDEEKHPYPGVVLPWEPSDGNERDALREGLRAADDYAFQCLTEAEQREHRRGQAAECAAMLREVA